MASTTVAFRDDPGRIRHVISRKSELITLRLGDASRRISPGDRADVVVGRGASYETHSGFYVAEVAVGPREHMLSRYSLVEAHTLGWANDRYLSGGSKRRTTPRSTILAEMRAETRRHLRAIYPDLMQEQLLTALTLRSGEPPAHGPHAGVLRAYGELSPFGQRVADHLLRVRTEHSFGGPTRHVADLTGSESEGFLLQLERDLKELAEAEAELG